MNWDVVEGKWKQLKGDVKRQWGKLTDDDLDVIEGNRDKLVGKIQESYGIGKDDADRQVNDWCARNDFSPLYKAVMDSSRVSGVICQHVNPFS